MMYSRMTLQLLALFCFYHSTDSFSLYKRAQKLAVDNKGDANGKDRVDVSATQVSSFCKNSGQTPSDGTQIKGGSCSSLVFGSIPSTDKMPSTVILQPGNGEKVPIKQPLTIQVKASNIELGHFNDPNTHYYTTPQTLNKQGLIRGHLHASIQKVDDPTQPLDATKFDLFKGLDFEPDANGVLKFTFDGGLNVTGQYRFCTFTGADGHQPMIMPVAQRGAQDDCKYFEAVDNGAGGANAKDAKAADAQAAGGAQQGGKKNKKKGGNQQQAKSVDKTAKAPTGKKAPTGAKPKTGTKQKQRGGQKRGGQKTQ